VSVGDGQLTCQRLRVLAGFLGFKCAAALLQFFDRMPASGQVRRAVERTLRRADETLRSALGQLFQVAIALTEMTVQPLLDGTDFLLELIQPGLNLFRRAHFQCHGKWPWPAWRTPRPVHAAELAQPTSISDRPVIGSGMSSPSRVSMVGAMSRRLPRPCIFTCRGPTYMNGTGLVV
jgi:hypothetical protein